MGSNYELHVGVILKDSLESIGMSQAELCKKINVSTTIINEIIKGKRNMNTGLAKKLEPIFDFPAKFWMDIQLKYDIAKEEGKKILITGDSIFELEYSVNEIVDRIICYEKESVEKCKSLEGDSLYESDLTNLKIQKLLYFMQKKFIKNEGATLFNEKIEHWANGPVIPVVYSRLKKYGSKPVISENVKDIPLEEEIEKKVKALYVELSKKSTSFLIELSHKEKVWMNTLENEEITPVMIRNGK